MPDPTFREIELEKIHPNPKNPRGQDVRDKDKALDKLKASIKVMGLLVPLVVRETSKDSYQLIDGERRYWALKGLRRSHAPAWIYHSKMSEEEIRQHMFHIHMNRTPWNPIQECRALEDFYQKLVKKHGHDNEMAISHDLMILTGLGPRTLANRLQFLRWPNSVKDLVYEDEKDSLSQAYWHMVEIESKIVEPARKNYSEYFEKVDVDEVREFLFAKYKEGFVKAAVEVRKAAVIARAKLKGKDKRKALGILNELIRNPKCSYEEAEQEFYVHFPEMKQSMPFGAQALYNRITSLGDALANF